MEEGKGTTDPVGGTSQGGTQREMGGHRREREGSEEEEKRKDL